MHEHVTATAVPSAARQAAVRVLHRIEKDRAWAAPTLDAEIERTDLSERDRALATAITYGTLRVIPELDESLRRWVQRDLGKDLWVRALLRASAYQIRHLGRLPVRAIVHDAVSMADHERGKKVAGFVNAVLRRVADHRPEDPQPPSRLCVPAWLLDALEESIGKERTAALLALDADAPTIDLRVTRLADRDSLMGRIRTARPAANVQSGKLSPWAIRLRHVGDPRRLPGFSAGEFAVQEEGAQVVGLLAGAATGEQIADACAGRGGKTAQLLSATGTDGSVTAFDRHASRLEQIPKEVERLGLEGALELRPLDLTRDDLDLSPAFDRVLVDAPCTGLGTLQRRPEILLRTTPEDPGRMGEIQRAIFRNAARLLKPGGTLVYAVCSPMRQEGRGALDAATATGLRPAAAEAPWALEWLKSDMDGWLRIGPWTPGADASTDSFQVSRWTKPRP